MSDQPNSQTEQSESIAVGAPAPVEAARITGPRRPPSAALRSPAAHARLWIVAGLGLVLDLWSKEWAFHTLRQGGSRVLIPNVLEFRTTLNPGALFGIGAGHTELFLIASVLALALVVWMFAQCPARQWLTHIALGAILAGALGNMYDRAFVNLVRYPARTPAGPVYRYYLLDHTREDGCAALHEYPRSEGQPVDPTRHALELPAAAADRLDQPIGYVRDFIKIPTHWFGKREVWPWVFNVADMLLVGGVAILAVRLLRDRRRRADLEADREGGTELDVSV